MGVFHVFKIAQMVPHHAERLKCDRVSDLWQQLLVSEFKPDLQDLVG